MSGGGFAGEWFPIKMQWWLFLVLGPLALLLRNQGIGVGDNGLTLKGLGTRVLPWSDVEGVGPATGTGVAGALLSAWVVRSRSKGTLTLPVHQTSDPARLVAALEARGLKTSA